jgi:hypothetical protein
MARPAIEFCSAADLPELFSLFKTWYAFNPRMQEADYFAWQFRDCPVRLGDGTYDFLIARGSAGEIVGCLGCVGFEFRRGNTIEIGGWSHNWRVAEGYGGGMALLSRFMELADNRFYLRLNEASGRIVSLLRVPMIPAMPRWWAVVDAAHAQDVFQMTEPADRVVLGLSARLLGALKAREHAESVIRLDPDEEFGFSHYAAIDGWVRRSGRYLNWRYLDIPKHDYKIVRTEHAFAVYRIETIKGTDASTIHLMEWSFGPEETPMALATIMNAARERRPVLVDFHCTSHAIGRSLEPYGFVPQSATIAPMPDLFRPANHSGGYTVAIDLPPHRTKRYIDFDRWYITIGDSDIDRVKL